MSGGSPQGVPDAVPERRKKPRRTHHERCHHEGTAGSRCALRPPDQALEPEDEAVHLRRAQRHLHHRPAEDHEGDRDRLQLRQGFGRIRGEGPVRWHQEAGAGFHRKPGAARRIVLRKPALAGRHADQLHHHQAEHRPPQEA